MATVQYRRKPVVQKIVIPCGLVKPNETVVIEVPSSLKRHAVVVATRPRSKTVQRGDQVAPTEGYGDEGYNQEYYRPQEPEAYQEEGQDEQQAYGANDIYDISQTERAEREMLFKNLIEFHRARRNVIEGTKNIISRSFTGGEGIPYEQANSTNQYQEEELFQTATLDENAGYYAYS